LALTTRVLDRSEKVLIQQLRDFTAEGIVTRHDFREVPPKVEYTITDFGRTLASGKITSSP